MDLNSYQDPSNSLTFKPKWKFPKSVKGYPLLLWGVSDMLFEPNCAIPSVHLFHFSLNMSISLIHIHSWSAGFLGILDTPCHNICVCRDPGLQRSSRQLFVMTYHPYFVYRFPWNSAAGHLEKGLRKKKS